ncbi:MAG: replicative DNA helicase [Lentisphaeria bacterium]
MENFKDNKKSAINNGLLTVNQTKPHNKDAEVAVLGAMLLDPTAAGTAISTLRHIDAFYSPAHQIIFDAMVELSSPKGEAAIDSIVLINHLQAQNKLDEIGGAAYLAFLADSVPTVANIEHYVDIVKQNAILRRIIATCSEAIMRCYDTEEDVKTLLDLVEQQIFDVTQMNEVNDLQRIKPLVYETVQYIDKVLQHDKSTMGIKTGYETLDNATTGLKPGELLVIAARPSIGKTALALNMAANIALGPEKRPVGIFSLEMPARQLVMRLISSDSKVSTNHFTQKSPTTSEWEDVTESCNRLRESHIVIDDTGAIDILELRAKARRMKTQDNIEILFVDYLQLVRAETGRNASRENEVAKISGSLKALAKELSIPVVVLAQLNRQAEQGEKPKLSNLRESGAIEQDADVVALLHREREKQYEQGADATKPLDAELIIAKNRNGSTGLQRLNFFPMYTRFENKSMVDDGDIPAEDI